MSNAALDHMVSLHPPSVSERPVPTREPDTSALDAEWSDERPVRHSFIALKAQRPDSLVPHSRDVLSSRTDVEYDVWDSPHALLILVDLPGVDAEQISLALSSHALHLEVPIADHWERSSETSRQEIRVPIPEGISPDAVDACCDLGVLRVRVSKEHRGARRVEIRARTESQR